MILQVKLNFLSYPSECKVFNQLDCKMILHYCLFFSFLILVNAFQVFMTNSFLPLLFVSDIA